MLLAGRRASGPARGESGWAANTCTHVWMAGALPRPCPLSFSRLQPGCCGARVCVRVKGVGGGPCAKNIKRPHAPWPASTLQLPSIPAPPHPLASSAFTTAHGSPPESVPAPMCMYVCASMHARRTPATTRSQQHWRPMSRWAWPRAAAQATFCTSTLCPAGHRCPRSMPHDTSSSTGGWCSTMPGVRGPAAARRSSFVSRPAAGAYVRELACLYNTQFLLRLAYLYQPVLACERALQHSST